MARQALIKLRRGTGLPSNGTLAEGELAIDIAAKKLYSANSNGDAFTLSGDQYNMVQSGNATHGIVTLTVDNTVLSNDSIIITGGDDAVVAGNSSLINVNVTSTLSTVLGRGSTTTSTIGVGNTTITGFANVTTDLHVGTTSQFDGAITVGNSTVNAVISSAGNIDTDGTLTVAGASTINNTLAAGNTTVTGFANVSGAGTFGGAVNIDDATQSTSTSTGALIVDGGIGVAKNLYVGGNLVVEGTTTQVASTTVTIDDNLIKLAANQTDTDADLVDAGWYMTFDESDTQKYSGVVRDTSNSNKAFVFFEGVSTEPAGTATYTSSDLAYIEAIIDGGTY